MTKRWLVATSLAAALLLLSAGTSSAQIYFGRGLGFGSFPRYGGLGYLGYGGLGYGYLGSGYLGGRPFGLTYPYTGYGYGAYGNLGYGTGLGYGYGAYGGLGYLPAYNSRAYGYGLGSAPYTAGYYSPSYAYSSSFYPRYVAPYNPSATSGTARAATTPSYPPAYPGTAGEEAIDQDRAVVEVRVPADAELLFEGERMNTPGPLRTFRTPRLESGKKYSYEVQARWTEGGKPVERTRKVSVRPGQRVTVDFLDAEDSRRL